MGEVRLDSNPRPSGCRQNIDCSTTKEIILVRNHLHCISIAPELGRKHGTKEFESNALTITPSGRPWKVRWKIIRRSTTEWNHVFQSCKFIRTQIVTWFLPKLLTGGFSSLPPVILIYQKTCVQWTGFFKVFLSMTKHSRPLVIMWNLVIANFLRKTYVQQLLLIFDLIRVHNSTLLETEELVYSTNSQRGQGNHHFVASLLTLTTRWGLTSQLAQQLRS